MSTDTAETERPWGVLFLCTGNSARSIIAESLLRHWGGDRFRAHSAGSDPAGAIRPEALAVLERAGLPTEGLASKSWQAFAGEHAPPIDFVITVCDSAAERCPILPGEPITAHWGIEDPAGIADDDARARAFHRAYTELDRRVQLFVRLPLASLDRLARRQQIQALAEKETAS